MVRAADSSTSDPLLRIGGAVTGSIRVYEINPEAPTEVLASPAPPAQPHAALHSTAQHQYLVELLHTVKVRWLKIFSGSYSKAW